MSDLQLERSVLEAKERDELFAIALALGTSPAARTKKADLVSHILQVTGVEADVAPAMDKPRRPRARKPAAGAEDAPVAEDGATQLELGHTNGHSPQVAAEQSDQAPPAPAGNGNQSGHAAASPADRAPTTSGDNQGGDGSAGFQRADQGRPRHDLDPGLGNSRRRRRRNREKTPRPAEREFTAPVTEVTYTGELVPCSGLLDLREEGYGFLRTNGYLASATDVYVSITQVRRYGLRKGDLVEGSFRPAANNEKYPALVKVESVAGLPPDDARNRPKFESLTPLFPDDKLSLEIPGEPGNVTARIVDLVSPIGKGQRGLIVSPPKAGKTTVLKQIAHSIEANNPDVHLMVLLVDERPEEVTDMRRSVKGEVIASTFDRPADEHTQVSELAIERAKRLVEVGRDVVIVLDGITRLARAYNLAQPATGRIMSGGIDTGALYPPKKFFGSARNIEEGGSLTILATALVETGSRMDEVIFEEFKGTGNMELRLDRKLAERRIYPALDVNASSTRHEELLFDRNQLQQVWKLRRVLNALASDGNGAAGLELLVDKIRSTRSNEQFLAEIAKTPAPAI
jgi:transcription termination factor Rho